jgi:signal transduction histidine kinase
MMEVMLCQPNRAGSFENHYNEIMFDNDLIRIRNASLMDLAIYLTLTIFLGTGLVALPDMTERVIISVFLIAFGVAHTLGYRNASTSRQVNIYMAVQSLITAAMFLRFPAADLFSFLLFILVIQAAIALPPRIAIRWIVLLFFIDSLRLFEYWGIERAINLLIFVPIYFLAGVFGYSLRQAEIARREKELLFEELQKTQTQLEELAITKERTRLARELHDSLGHRLTVAVVQLEGAQRLIPTKPEQAIQMIATMRDELKSALTDLRSTVTAMRDSIVKTQTLESALLTLSESFQRNTGLTTHFSPAPNFPTLPEAYRFAFYRAAQEGLTNVQRHAHAQNAWIQVYADRVNLSLIVEDDGMGSEQHAQNDHGTGLLGLRERAEQLGGRIQIDKRPGGGTRLSFIAPLPEKGITND